MIPFPKASLIIGQCSFFTFYSYVIPKVKWKNWYRVRSQRSALRDDQSLRYSRNRRPSLNDPVAISAVDALAKMGLPLPGAISRLATYGSLAPGKPNHYRLAELGGIWKRGVVNGRVMEAGWGAALGFPGLILEPSGSAVEVHVLESANLPGYWERLDTFEGPGYRRVITSVRTDEGSCDAFIYVLT